jgi:hypothetical protein
MGPFGQTIHYRLLLHGLPANVRCNVAAVNDAVRSSLREFIVDAFPPAVGAPTEGAIRPYDKDEVMRYLSPDAERIANVPRETAELYRQDERVWMIDDRWGLTEINLLKSQWRSWVLPDTTAPVDRLIEMLLLWPLGQLLRPRGLDLIPSVTVTRGGNNASGQWGVMLLSPFGIEPELTHLLRCGFRLTGQRWTALRDDGDGVIQTLHMPGKVERLASGPRAPTSAASPDWVDLEGEFVGCVATRATCDTVVLVEPGRRPTSHLREIPPAGALAAIRRAWPIAELLPHRVHGQMPAKLARRCRVYAVRLSRRPADLLDLLEAARAGEARGEPLARRRAG